MRTLRRVAGSLVIVGFVVLVTGLARATAQAPLTALGVSIAVLGAILSIVALGSLYEWLVHRFIYHGPSRIELFQSIHDIHQRGHHWHRFPPDRYVELGPIERIPVFPADPFAVCGKPLARGLAWAGQYALYMAVGIPFAFVPAWLATRNPLFTVTCVIAGMTVCYFFIRVHDVIHYPRQRRIENWRWFRFLDRHHYLHHVDNRANINFLLPLCDWLFGTLKLELSQSEARRWPSFAQAKHLETEAVIAHGSPIAAKT
jgi:hypothetical protein